MRMSCSSRLARSHTAAPPPTPFRLHLGCTSAAPRLHLGCTSATHLGYTSPQPARIQTTSGSLPSGSYLRSTTSRMDEPLSPDRGVRPPADVAPRRARKVRQGIAGGACQEGSEFAPRRPFGRDTPARPAKAASMRCVLWRFRESLG